jgi:hypothetical protein
MNKKSSFLGMLILCLAAAVFAFTPASGSQKSQAGECEKACTKTYDDCLKATGADAEACKKALDACLLNCTSVKVNPSPTPMASPSPSPMPSPSPEASPTPMEMPSASPSPSPPAGF